MAAGLKYVAAGHKYVAAGLKYVAAGLNPEKYYNRSFLKGLKIDPLNSNI